MSVETTAVDPRIEAFCKRSGPDIFRPVAYPTDIWSVDPFDVETIHVDARECFRRLLDRATAFDETAKIGRMLLLKGESGSGKTHLMRAFRTEAHRLGRGYFGYMQMTSATANYGRYILQKVIDSLDHPYIHALDYRDPTTGLARLSTAIADSSSIPRTAIDRLREEELDRAAFSDLLEELADRAAGDPMLRNVDLDLLRAMLALQSSRPAIRSRVIKFLRGELLSEGDCRWLAGVVPIDRDENALAMVERLGKLMWSVQQASLIVCVDQLEGIYDADQARERFRRAIEGLIYVASHVPTSIVVISCLEDYYDVLAGNLDKSARDRVEFDPTPIKLQSGRSAEEIERIVAKQLQVLYDEEEVEFVASDPTFPLPKEKLAKLVGARTRDVLQWCKDYRDACLIAGTLVEPGKSVGTVGETDGTTGGGGEGGGDHEFDEEWSDHLNEHTHAPPDEDDALAKLLASTVESLEGELDGGLEFLAETNVNHLRVTAQQQGDAIAGGPYVGVCNGNPQGGGLGKQLDKVLESFADTDLTPVIVRSTPYTPKGPKTEIAKKYRAINQKNGRFVTIQDSEWRAMAAFPSFHKRYNSRPGYDAWRKQVKPLAQMQALRSLLDLDHLMTRMPEVKKPDAPKPQGTPKRGDAPPTTGKGTEETTTSAIVKQGGASTALAFSLSSPLSIGVSLDRAQRPIDIAPAALLKHAAFLGGTGSGKTTVALNLIEQLLLQGVPAILVDRKGDLAGYADPKRWTEPQADPILAERQQRLAKLVDVRLYTPGQSDGYPICLPVAPEKMFELTTSDRTQTSVQAAHSLGEMLKYKSNGTTGQRMSILVKAIEVLGAEPQPITLELLIEYLREQDPGLLAAIGGLDVKQLDKLAQDLQMLAINRPALFPKSGAALNADLFFGLGPHAVPNKTRLSVISTKFLGGIESVQFWVAQLLMELARWASRNPKDALQAVVLFDEADIYLPAVGKPAAKEPMENLLKRARSAGLGLFLATQSPGDFDYKCRENIATWLLGRVKEQTALAKLKPTLASFPRDVSGELASQQTGELFLVRESQVSPIKSQRNVIETKQMAEHEIIRLAARRTTS